jgi:heterodisulfide reductase subunit C
MEKTQTMSFVKEVSQVPGGEGVNLCMQCGTCTASCPSVKIWEFTPSEVIAMVRADMRDAVLSSSSMWCCLSWSLS